MATCPYPTHKKPQPIQWDHLTVASCREGCGRTLFSCPRCQEANRPFARYCRQCGESVSFGATLADNVPPLREGRNESHKLSKYGVAEVQAIKTHRGFLIVVADRSVLIFDLHKIHEPLYQFSPPDGRIVRGVSFVQGNEDQLLVSTSRTVYRLGLLNMELDGPPVYEVGAHRYITHPVVECGEHLYALVLDEPAQSSRLVRLPNEDVITFDGVGHSFMQLSGERLFFCTREDAFLFEDGKVLKQRLLEPLIETNAAYSSEQNMIYLVGESGLWRIRLSPGEMTPGNLPTRLLATTRLAARGDNVFIAHTQGFLVLDPFGGLRWDSTQQYIRAESDGLDPQVTDQYVLFTALGQSGGSDLRIHALNNLNEFKPLAYEQRLLCPPLLTNGRIYAAAGSRGAAVLNCAT